MADRGWKGVTVRVLVIEDDEEMAEAVASGLRRARMAVDVAFDGRAGLERALLNDYDVVVLDDQDSHPSPPPRKAARWTGAISYVTPSVSVR